MKLNMEFEASDLEEMILDYFERNGFEVLDVASIIEKFTNIYPEGIVIQVKAAPVSPFPAPSLSVVTPVEELPVAYEEEGEEETEATPPRMSFNDLMDPTGDSGVPGRDQLLADRELLHVLQQSKALEDAE